jgi:hypothetical protein
LFSGVPVRIEGYILIRTEEDLRGSSCAEKRNQHEGQNDGFAGDESELPLQLLAKDGHRALLENLGEGGEATESRRFLLREC